MTKTINTLLFIIALFLIFGTMLIIAGHAMNQRIAEGNTRADQAIARSEISLGGRR